MSDYIQDTVNGYLARITDAPIRIEWDGQPVSRDDPAHFNVHVYGEPTSFYAVDYPTGLSLFEEHGHTTASTRSTPSAATSSWQN